METRSVTTLPDEQRAAFEAAMKLRHPLWQFQDDGTGGYHNGSTEWAWIGWQAALSALPAGGWIPVSQRLPEDGLPVMVFTPAMDGEDERIDFEFRDDGCWYHHNDCYDHYMAVGGSNAVPGEVCTGPGPEAPYTHWRTLPAAPQQQESTK